MAFNRLSMDYASGICHYVADTIDDIKTLPRNSALGSSCYVINRSTKFIKNSLNQWIEQTNNNNNNSGNNASSPSTPSFQNKIVNVLPQIGEEGILYLVPNSYGEDDNLYKEFIFINNNWEQLGAIDSELIPINVNSIDDYFR